jgi:hypothetical protein
MQQHSALQVSVVAVVAVPNLTREKQFSLNLKRGDIMSCPTHKRLCDNLVISESVTFAGGVLVVNLPQATYTNKCKYCIVIAQAIPTTTTIEAPVVINIGDDTTQYPLKKG